MKRNIKTGPKTALLGLTLAFAVSGALAGCSGSSGSNGFKKTFGLVPTPPDAFAVGTQAPLSLPPELGQLPPPNPGQPRPQQIDAGQQGLYALSPASSISPAPDTSSPGEQSFLDQAGPTPPETIRAQVNQQALIASKPTGFVSELMGNGPPPPATVNAAAENRRLQENAALGQPATNGATPQNSSQNQGFFQKIFSAF